MSGDLIRELTEIGNEQDNALVSQWGSIDGAPFSRIQIKLARKFSYKMGADLEANDIIKTMPTEEMGNKFTEAYELAKPLCESPIERLILPWLIGQEYPGFNRNPCVLRPGDSLKYVPYTVAIIPQLPIGRHRVDFALAASRKDKKIRFVVVECDGAEFHDSVKNVVKDVVRDVRLLENSRVLDVVRIEGKDIYRDPQMAAVKAAMALKWAWSYGNEKVAHKFVSERDGDV